MSERREVNPLSLTVSCLDQRASLFIATGDEVSSPSSVAVMIDKLKTFFIKPRLSYLVRYSHSVLRLNSLWLSKTPLGVSIRGPLLSHQLEKFSSAFAFSLSQLVEKKTDDLREHVVIQIIG